MTEIDSETSESFRSSTLDVPYLTMPLTLLHTKLFHDLD